MGYYRFLGIVAACWMSLVGAGCEPSGRAPAKAPQDSGPQLERVTLALNWFPEVEHGGYYAALVHGYYRDAGLDVEILPGGPSAPVVAQVATGQVAFGVANADNLLFGRAEDAPVVALFAPLQTSPRCLMVHEGSGIRKFEDLKNITLAMSDGAAFAQYLRKRIPLEHVRIVPYSGSVAPFLLDQRYAQQGYVFSEPYIARKQGGHPRVLMLSDLGFNPYTSLLFTSESLLASKESLVRRMVEACERGWQHYLRSPAETNRYIAGLNPEMDLDILLFGARAIRPLAESEHTARQGLGTMSLDRWTTLEKQLVETDQLKPHSVVVEEVFTTRFLSKRASSEGKPRGATGDAK